MTDRQDSTATKTTFWTDLAKKAKGYAKAAEKGGYHDIAKKERDFAKWCEDMNRSNKR